MNDIPSLTQTFDPRNGGIVSFGSDERLIVMFSNEAVQNNVKSNEAGRPIFDTVPFVRIQQPGERDFIKRAATQHDKLRFRRQWDDFQRGEQPVDSGTPLSILFPANPDVIENLKYFGIRTVEHLANATDTAIQNIGLGGFQWRDMAKAFIAKSDGGAEFTSVLARLERLEQDVKVKDQRIAALQAELAAIDFEDEQPAQPRRRGRPPRTAIQE